MFLFIFVHVFFKHVVTNVVGISIVDFIFVGLTTCLF